MHCAPRPSGDWNMLLHIRAFERNAGSDRLIAPARSCHEAYGATVALLLAAPMHWADVPRPPGSHY